MNQLQWDVRLTRTVEPAASVILEAARLLDAGERVAAEQGYADARSRPWVHAGSWSSLAALAIGLGDAPGARAHAEKALRLDGGNADAWVNFGVASWMQQLRRDAAQATHRALQLVPGMEAAALNLSLMHQAVGQPASARMVLADALERNPGSLRLHRAMADLCRLLGDPGAAREHALRALALWQPVSRSASAPIAMPPAQAQDSGSVRQALFAAQDALGAAGIPFHLIGGTLLAIHRDGHLFPHDKDVDLGLPFDCDRDRVAAAFAGGFRPVLRADDPNALASREWVMGVVHLATGIGVDLMFVRERDGLARFQLGWPDELACELPAYALDTIDWAGRTWQVPSPPEHYLAALYGPDWNGDPRSRGFDRRWFDTQVSNPSRTADSLPRAVTLGLLRLLKALQASRWEQARALCVQLLAREELAEVRSILAGLDDQGVE